MGTRAVLYARFSSALQRDASIDDQLRICRERAAREGWTIVDEFTDHAFSGASKDRPGYQALLACIRTRHTDIVLAESVDRLSRDLEHTAGLYKEAVFADVRIVTLADGEVGDLQISFRGLNGALYLKDLRDKTLRGLTGRILQGRCIGLPPYGYTVLRRVRADGEPERGLRAIVPEQATVIRRIYRDYAAGLSPRRIATALNAEHIPGPGGGLWHDATIRGRPLRGDGILRNPLYIGQLVWNRVAGANDPSTGARRRRLNGPGTAVSVDKPDLRIIDQSLWDAVQRRIREMAMPNVSQSLLEVPVPSGFWEHRRPRYLLSGKVVCGVCSAKLKQIGKDYLTCPAARAGSCRNMVSLRRGPLEAHVLDLLGSQLMPPDVVAAFVARFTAEWNRLAVEASAEIDGRRRELQGIERKIDNLIHALAEDGHRSPNMLKALAALEVRQAELRQAGTEVPSSTPALHPNLGTVYRNRVASLQQALARDDGAAALEAARSLIDKVMIHPPEDPSDPPGVELVGNLLNMLHAASAGSGSKPSDVQPNPVLSTFVRSIKDEPRAEPPPCFLPIRPRGDPAGTGRTPHPRAGGASSSAASGSSR